MLHLTGGGDQDPAGGVMALNILQKVVGSKGPDHPRGTEDRVAQGVTAPQLAIEEIVDQIIRSILHHGDLLQNHLALVLHLGGHKGGVQDDIAQQIGQLGQAVGQNGGVKAGGFGGGKGVGHPAHHIEFASDLVGIPASGALEDHMLDEMRTTAGQVMLIAGPDLDPDPHRNHPGISGLGNDPHSIIQRTLFKHKIRVKLHKQARTKVVTTGKRSAVPQVGASGPAPRTVVRKPGRSPQDGVLLNVYSSAKTALRLSLILPRESISRTLTRTSSPSLRTSLTFSTRRFSSSEIWTRPSVPGRI